MGDGSVDTRDRIVKKAYWLIWIRLFFPTFLRTCLSIPLADIQRDEKSANAIVSRNRSRDLNDFLLAEMLFQICKHCIRHAHIERHGIRVGQHGG
jgi:hypothetical protein